MQRLKWLYEDALTRARLPFIPYQTQLELLGFLLSGPHRQPGPVEILAQSGGRRYILAHDGSAREWRHYPRDEVLMPDVPAAGGTVCVGHCAYNLGDGQVIWGAPSQVRRELRRLIPKLNEIQILAIDRYVLERAQSTHWVRSVGPTAVFPRPISLPPAPAVRVAVLQP